MFNLIFVLPGDQRIDQPVTPLKSPVIPEVGKQVSFAGSILTKHYVVTDYRYEWSKTTPNDGISDSTVSLRVFITVNEL